MASDEPAVEASVTTVTEEEETIVAIPPSPVDTMEQPTTIEAEETVEALETREARETIEAPEPVEASSTFPEPAPESDYSDESIAESATEAPADQRSLRELFWGED
jgi:hypothetical protein